MTLNPVTYTVTISPEDLEQVGELDFAVTQRHLEVAAEVMAESQNFTQDLLDALPAAKYIVRDEA